AEDILLSQDVDEFWHTYILQTLKYSEDCERVFGTYLHHAPHVGEVTPADAALRSARAEKTRRLYERAFGTSADVAALCDATVREAAMRVGARSQGSATSEVAAFSGATSSDAAAFSGATRSDAAAFSGATSSDAAAFSGATSSDAAAFSGAVRSDAAA